MIAWFKKQDQNVKDVLSIFFFSVVIFSIFFPEYHIFPKIAMFRLNFNEGYTSAQIVANQMYQGGIQLWARDDQMPYAYYTLTFGVYKIYEIITAFLYGLCSPLIWDQGKSFHHLYSFVVVVTSLFLKVVGSYLLLRRFTSSRILLYASAVFLATFMSVQIVREGVGYQSFYPLAIHLALKIFEDLRLKDVWIFLTFMLFVGVTSIIQGLYLYCDIHYLLLAAGLWSFWAFQSRWRTLGPDLYREFQSQRVFFISTVVVWILIAAPFAYLVKYGMGDFFFDAANSRINNIWSVKTYLSKVVPGTNEVASYLWESGNFTQVHAWAFLGGMVVFFSIAALMFSPEKRKYIFLANIIVLLMIASAASGPLLDSMNKNVFAWVGHWLAILTNPFKFVLRDFQEESLHVMPFMFMPLALMGMEALCIRPRRTSRGKTVAFIGLMFLYAAIFMWHIHGIHAVYIVAMVFLMTVLVTVPALRVKKGILMALFLVDGICFLLYLCPDVKANSLFHEKHAVAGKPEWGELGLKYHNPHILPFREYFAHHLYHFDQNYYLTTGILNYTGSIFHFTNMAKHRLNFDPYQHPRHKTFESLPDDPVAFNLIFPEGPLVYHTAYAVKDTPEAFNVLKQNGMVKDVVLVPDEGQGGLSDTLPSPILTRTAQTYEPHSFTGLLEKERMRTTKGLRIYSIPYPSSCPSYRATTFLTMDRDLLQFSIADLAGQSKALFPVQGAVVAGMTFDVNNIRKGWITVGLGPEDTAGQYTFTCYKAVTGITNVWKNQEDNIGFDYNALRNGWLVILYPYDPKWKISIDNQPVKFYRANHLFITVPMPQGNHKILLQYWPDTPLRGWLLLSIFLTCIVLVWVIIHSLSPKENHGNK